MHPDGVAKPRNPITGIFVRSCATGYARQGGLAYGTNLGDLFRRSAGYVDRILKGAKPEDLPVQGLTAFECVINLNTAKALGLAVPQSLLARADDVIE